MLELPEETSKTAKTNPVPRTNYLPHPAVSFKLSYKPVKTILVSYLEAFSANNLFDLSKTIGCSIFSFPDAYLRHAKLITAFNKLPAEFAKGTSLYNLSGAEEPLTFKRIPQGTVIKLNQLRSDIIKNAEEGVPGAGAIELVDGEETIEFQKWNIYLLSAKNDELTPVEFLDQFQNDKFHVMRMIEGAYQGARGVFHGLRTQNAPDFDTIDLKFDPEKLCLSLVDSRFPKYEHPIKITFRLERIA